MEEVTRGTLPHKGSQQFRFLKKALLAPDGSKDNEKVCSASDVEETKAVLRLFPIWATCLLYACVCTVVGSTKQGITMDRSVGPRLMIPAALLQTFITLAIIIFIPIYDCIFVPIMRSVTKNPSGITMLQRIGTGILLSTIAIMIAGLVEMKRLKTAEQYGLIDLPKATDQMSVCLLIPQYILFGVAEPWLVCRSSFYDQVTNELSVGLTLYLSIFGVGSFLSSFLISALVKITNKDGQGSWFNDNLNQAHLDYFYWLLAGLSAVGLATYLYFAKSYVYNRVNSK